MPPSRERLGFVKKAKDHFSFLERRGFHPTLNDAFRVRYEKEGLIVDVIHEPTSYELDFEVTCEDGSHPIYRSSDAMYVLDPNGAPGYRLPAATSPSSVDTGLSQLAVLLQSIVGPKGPQESTLTALAAARAKAEQHRRSEERKRRLHRQAREAWEGGDLRLLIKTVAQLGDRATSVEQGWLQYAKARIGP